MTINTFKVDRYRDCPIYYRNFGDHFEYLTIINGELYTSHVSISPHWITEILYYLGIEKLPYSEQQLKNAIKVLRRLAETTINSILGNN